MGAPRDSVAQGDAEGPQGLSAAGPRVAGRKRRAPAEDDARGSTVGAPSDPDGPPMSGFVTSGEARSGGGTRVRDPATGKYVFQTFRQQLQQQLQHGPPGGRQLSALDVMELQVRGERHRWKRLREGADEQEAEKQRERIETEESSFSRLVKHILQGVEARGPARQLLIRLSTCAPSLPLLLLEQQQIVEEVLLHLRSEETYNVALQLLPALAKDLRWGFLGHLESCVEALHVLLFDLEDRHDADGVQRLFQCLTQIFRYLHKYLVANIEDFLDIMLPLLLHAPPPNATQKRKRPLEAEQQQQQPPEQQKQQKHQEGEEQQARKRRSKELQQKQQRARAPQRRPRTQQHQRPQQQQHEVKIASASCLAAQAAASLLRRVAAEGEFYDCVAAIFKYFLVVPSRWFPVFAACASRIFFECIRGVEGDFSSRFESLSCFLISNVLLRQPFTVPASGAKYDPPPLGVDLLPAEADPRSTSSSNSSSTVCGRRVYMAQVECARLYLEEARNHAASMESPAAAALQRVTLRFLVAVMHAALREATPLEHEQRPGGQPQQRKEECEEERCLLSSSFSLFFTLHPFRPLILFPYFMGEAQPFACRSRADKPCSIHCLPPPVLVGCCALADAAASWFASPHRSTGSFDGYIQTLIEGLLPFCMTTAGTAQGVGVATAEDKKWKQHQLVLPALLQPLLRSVPNNSDWTAAAAVALLLPCSVLRLIAFAWRAVPISYANAVSLKGNPLQHLLPAVLAAQRYQQEVLRQNEQPSPAEGEWRRALLLERMAEVCCCSLRMLLLVPAPADGFASLCLRYAVDFLAGQPTAHCDALEAGTASVGGILPRPPLRGKDKYQLLLEDASSWRWAAASSLLAALLKAFGRDSVGMATSKTVATIRLLLPLHVGGHLKGTRLELERLEASLKDYLSNVRRRREAMEEGGPSAHLGLCLARASAGLLWLWQLQKALPYAIDEAAVPTIRVELASDAYAAAVQLQQHLQQLLCLLLEALECLPLGQESNTLREGLIHVCSRSFVTFLALPRLIGCREKDGALTCPSPPASLVERCGAHLNEAAAACAAANGAEDSTRCNCGGAFKVTTETRLSVEELDEGRRCLVEGGGATEVAQVPAHSSSRSAQERWLDCLLSVLLASSLPSVRRKDEAGIPALIESPALVKSLCLALKLHSACNAGNRKPSQEQLQRGGLHMLATKLLLPNLSSGSPKLRLWSLRFICSCDPKLLLSCSWCSAFACSSCSLQSAFATAEGMDTFVGSLLQRLDSLERLQVDLDTERQKIQLIHVCAKELRSVQEALAAAEAAGGGCRGPQCGGPVLLLQVAYRVLLAGLSVKFATVWPEVVEALSGCLEAFHEFIPARCQTALARSPTEYFPKPKQQPLLPPQNDQRNAGLAFVWALVVSETHRALRQLDHRQKQPLQCPLQPKQQRGIAGDAQTSCQQWVESAWRDTCAKHEAGEETAPLERHSHLLRILQRFASRWGSNAFSRNKKHPQKPQQGEAGADTLPEAARPCPSGAASPAAWRRSFAQEALRFLLIYGQEIAAQLTRAPGSLDAAVESDAVGGEVASTGPVGVAEVAGDSNGVPSSSSEHLQRKGCIALQANMSLIPRAQDVLRAILAHGEMRFPNAGRYMLGLPELERTEGKGMQQETDERGKELEALWCQLLVACTQRLISVRDASLQSLVLQILLLCKELQPVLQPYLSVLKEALQDKGGAPSGLLRLILGKDGAERQLVQPSAETQDDILLVPEHRAFMLPLIVRLLISKTQVKMGRSPGAVLASRRRIFGLLSSLEEAEIPMVLAVFTLRLVRLTQCGSPTPSEDLRGDSWGLSPLQGLDKERALVTFIRWQHRRAQAAALPASIVADENEATTPGEPSVTAALSHELFRPSASTQLHGLLKSLQQLVQMQRHVLRPAAPFLVFLFAEVLQRLVPTGPGAYAPSREELRELAIEEEGERDDVEIQPAERAEAHQAEQEQREDPKALTLTAANGGELAGAPSARHKKHCIRIVIDSLHQLLSSFPDLASAWKRLLSPAAPALQLLLSAAVETGAAGRVADVKGRVRSPAIVRLVASWASNAEYFMFYEEVLPQALPTLLGVMGSIPLLRYLQRSKRSTTPLVEAAIETALLLSFGGRTKEQQEEDLRLARRQFNAMKQVNERKRRRTGYQSSSSDEESEEGEQEAQDGFIEDDKAQSLQSFREAHEALQQQQEMRQQEGMRVLAPHIGLLLQSIELLLAARRGADVSARSLSSESAADALRAPADASATCARDGTVQPSLSRRARALLVGFKELQLLTRLAAHACADQDRLQQQPQAEHGIPTAARLVRLLLLSLPLRVRSGGAAARQQLTLSVIQGLLPAMARWRRALASKPSSSSELRELCELLRGLHASCCSLLDSAEDLQCRAATSEVLLATELAACGCEVTEEVLGTRIRGFALKQLDAFRRAEEEGQDADKEASPVSWLVPGGVLNRSLLENALPSLLVADGKDTVSPKGWALSGEWRICVALVMVCANLLKAEGGIAPDEQRPDVDMQVLVLLALVEKHLTPPALTQCSQQDTRMVMTKDTEDSEAAKEKDGDQQEETAGAEQGETNKTSRTQQPVETPATDRQRTEGAGTPESQRLFLPASTLEPLMHHVLYLLSDCSDDLTLQHVALTVIRRAAVALGAAASAAATRRAAAQFAAQQPQDPKGEETETDWQYAICMQRHITGILIPHLRRLLRSLKEDGQRMALRAFDALIRTLGPAGPLLPPMRVAAADDGEISALFLSTADETHRNMRLHLDLYALLTPTKLTPAVEEAAALAQQLVASGEASKAAAAAAKAAQLEALAGEHQASEREGGGDVVLELLHMQKHRRARGMQLLAKAAGAQRLCPNTLRHFCVPLALSAILQINDGGDAAGKKKGAKASSRHYKGRTEAFSQQMADQGVTCLAQCCTRVSLKCCTQTLRQLVTHLANAPQPEAFIYRAVAETIKAFPFGLSDAVQQTLSNTQLTVQHDKQHGDASMPVDSGAAAKQVEPLPEEQGQAEQKAAPPSTSAKAGEEASSADEASDREDADGVIPSQLAAEKRKVKVEACIRDELIPMLYRLAFGSKIRRVASKDIAAEEPGKVLEGSEGKKYDNPVVRTELVAVLALLARLLPPKEFHLQLPRLVRTIAFSLRSRERNARREARVALTHLAVNLGPPYFTYLVTELVRMLGPKNEKDEAANQKGFLRPVLIFTLHAMLNSLLQQRSSSPEAPLLRTAEEAATIDGTHFIQRFEAVVPLLLPLIAEEINRVADPDRLEQEESRRALAGHLDGEDAAGPTSTAIGPVDDGSTRSKIEEAQTLKGPPMLLLLARESSAEGLAEHLLPFVLGLLTGVSCKRDCWSRGAAFSSKYVHRAEDLLLHFVFGLSRNNKVLLERKLRTAKQLLILTVATLQFPLLHPLLQAERSLDESLYLLARQHLLLLDRKRRGKKNRSNGTSADASAASEDGTEATTPTPPPEAQDGEAQLPPALSPSHQEDLLALRLLLLPEAKDEDAGLLAQHAAAAAPTPHRRSDLASQHSRKLLVSLLKGRMERRFTLQPGAVTGRSLAQATRNKPGPGGGGLDLSTRASVLGTAALRLLHLAVKASKAQLRQCRGRQLGEVPKAVGQAALHRCLNHLDELALEVVCCFSCKATKLVSWGARCLLELLSLRLPRLENRGALVVYLTMRIFHSCGSGSGVAGADYYTARSELLPICTKLLAVLLLQPQAAKWMDTALNPSQHIGGDILRSLLREQLRILPWRYEDQLLQQQKGQRPQQSGAAVAASPPADGAFNASLAVTEEQLQAAGHFFLKEALLAHISSSLEDSQLQLCALFLFKRVVLQHYKDLAGDAARRALEGSQRAAGAMDTKALQRHAQKKRRRDAKAAEAGEDQGEKHSTASADLLPLVYECVDRVARVMVQHATSSALSQKLSNICADAYVSFLLNFPMTPKLQQRRVFFLFQQQKFSDVYGRRAAIAALHKVVRRFPAELFLERYGQIALLTCCSTLATEADKIAHGMLQEIVDDVLQLAEVADDPSLGLHDFLKAVSTVLLLPRTQHLMALLEFLNVFVPHVARGAPQRSLSSFLPKVLQLLSAVSSLAAAMHQPEALDSSGDWRLTYKTLLVMEQLMDAAGLPLMEESFGKAAKILRTSGCEKLLNLAAAAKGDAEEAGKQATQRSKLEAFITTLDVWGPSTEGRKKRRDKTDAGQQELTQQQQQQVVAGLHAAQLWNELAGLGLHHENAWVRCAALRCVSHYLQQTPVAAWRRADAPLLAYIVVRRTRPSERRHRLAQSSPLTDLGLALGQHFGRDTMLERHPYAAPCALAALVGWAHLAFTLPHLTPVARKLRGGARAKQHMNDGLLHACGEPEVPREEQLENASTEPAADTGAEEELTGKSGDGAVVAKPAAADHADSGAPDAARKEDKEGDAAAEETAATSATSSEGQPGDVSEEKELHEDADGEPASAALDGNADSEDEAGGGEAVELVMQEMQLEASKDDTATYSALPPATPSVSIPDASWSASTPSGDGRDSADVSSGAEEAHPLVFLVAGLSRWLRVHLGRLGYTGDALKGTDAPPGTVVRVAGILTFFGSLLKLLPLAELRDSSGSAAGATAPTHSVLMEVLRHIADAAYRCSTLHTELAADSVMTLLIEEKDAPKGESGKGGAVDGHTLWGNLRGLTPMRQLMEVATGGSAVLRRMEQLLRSSGLEETYRLLLASTRQRVSAKRVMRKLKSQRVFLENPQAHAQRKRRRNETKGLQRKAKLRQAILRRHGFVKRKQRVA